MLARVCFQEVSAYRLLPTIQGVETTSKIQIDNFSNDKFDITVDMTEAKKNFEVYIRLNEDIYSKGTLSLKVLEGNLCDVNIQSKGGKNQTNINLYHNPNYSIPIHLNNAKYIKLTFYSYSNNGCKGTLQVTVKENVNID